MEAKRQGAGDVVIGIDVGGSTTKIVGFRRTAAGAPALIEPLFVRATDPITSIYGAFGRFTVENGLTLPDIDRIMMTGVGSSYMSAPIYSLDCRTVPEFSGVGLGGLYLSGCPRLSLSAWEPVRRWYTLSGGRTAGRTLTIWAARGSEAAPCWD